MKIIKLGTNAYVIRDRIWPFQRFLGTHPTETRWWITTEYVYRHAVFRSWHDANARIAQHREYVRWANRWERFKEACFDYWRLRRFW